MTKRVSVPKKELHRFHVQASLFPFKRRGRKQVIPDQKEMERFREDRVLPQEEDLSKPNWKKRLAKQSQTSELTPANPNAEVKPKLLKKSKRSRRKNQTDDSITSTQQRPEALIPRFWWSLLWLGVFSILGVSVVSGLLLLTKLPPPVNCKQISSLSPEADRLYCAQVTAKSGKLEQLLTAIKLIQYVSADHPLYAESQRLLKEWSLAILQMTRQKITQGDLLAAVKLASNIPATSPVYNDAQTVISKWQEHWQKGEEVTRKFNQALKVQNWQLSSDLMAIGPFNNPEYWTVSRTQALMQQYAEEKQAWQQLEEARELAKTNRLTQLQEAIVIAGKIASNTYVKAKAQVEQTRWSRTLLQLAAISFQKQDFAGMVKVLEAIPVNNPLYQEAQDWLQLANSSKTAKEDNILALVDALAGIRQIAPNSPVQSIANKQATLWQSQLQDHIQLQYAVALASVEQRPTLQMAIDQASKIPQKNPKRIFAQTLIAQWYKEIQKIDDRNNLAAASALAVGGGIEQLKQAVQVASLIKLGQPLRQEAQGLIANWNRQIQTIEDRPTLELSQTFAQRRDLISAISTAKQISPGRALYPEAQKAIADWVAQQQTAEDRPILEAATTLADQGRFDAAIATASQIAPERALYSQAQAAIADWKLQKESIIKN
jgi:hypothetical protein